MTRHQRLKIFRQQTGNALWVSVSLVVTVMWIGFVSMRTATTELELAGNVRERSMLRQAAEGAIKRMVGMCDLGPETFATRGGQGTVGTGAQPLLDCDATSGTCALGTVFQGTSEFNDFNAAYNDWWADPDGRGRYNYRTWMVPSTCQQIPRSTDFCMQKFDVFVEVTTPGSATAYTSRAKITAMPVKCTPACKTAG